MATPYDTIQRSGNLLADREKVARHVAEIEAGVVVVGLPLSMDGSTGPAAHPRRPRGGRCPPLPP